MIYVADRYCNWQHCQEGHKQKDSPPGRNHEAPPASKGDGGCSSSNVPPCSAPRCWWGPKAHWAVGSTAGRELCSPTIPVYTSGFPPQDWIPKGHKGVGMRGIKCLVTSVAPRWNQTIPNAALQIPSLLLCSLLTDVPGGQALRPHFLQWRVCKWVF